MSFRRGGAKKRRDANEKAIREALAALGCETWQLGGRGLPDLLIAAPGPTWLVCEVKTATGRKTEAQRDIRWPIIRSIDDAIALVRLC